MQTQISVQCFTGAESQFNWYINRWVPASGSFSSQSTPVENGTAEWKIPKCKFQYGLYKVTLIVRQIGADVDAEGSAFGYINITQSDLLAVISGGTGQVRGHGKILRFDGTQSQDPDLGPQENDDDMVFKWACKKESESFPDDLNSMKIVSLSRGAVDIGGCFGTGIGFLNHSVASIEVDSSLMLSNHTYTFLLLLCKGNRQETTSQDIKLVPGDPPQITLM